MKNLDMVCFRQLKSKGNKGMMKMGNRVERVIGEYSPLILWGLENKGVRTL